MTKDKNCRCDECWKPMTGILSYKSRTTCEGCGGKALNVLNKNPSSAEELKIKYRKKRKNPSYRNSPSPGNKRA